MDRQKSRKGHESRRFVCEIPEFPVNEKNMTHSEKFKYRRQVHSDKKKYDMNPNSHSVNWSAQHRMYPFSQRHFSTSDTSVCHYSVPLSFSFEPVSLPIYPALLQPQGNCTVPLEMGSYSNKSKHHKSYIKSRKSKINSIDQNKVPAMFHTPRVNSGDHQDYTSLPPVNCDIYAANPDDTESAGRRRFSDPGIGQLSSDECSSIRSDESNKSCDTAEPYDFLGLVEQVNELKENNSHLKRELQETKLELETLKMQSQTWRIGCEDAKPGALSDAINEIRNAVKLGEEALVSKVIQMLEQNSVAFKEAQEKLEEKLTEEMSSRIKKLEEKITTMSIREPVAEIASSEGVEVQAKEKDSSIQHQIVELEHEKLQLRKELQEAVAKRKSAEATTEKLERLVGILRKKINGVSLESCISDEKHILVRPLASSLEKNPFIIANNRQGQKNDTLSFQKPKISSFRSFSSENSEGINVNVNDNKENEAGESGSSNGVANNAFNSPTEANSVTAQVTITGPVTDL